uniref:T. congolense-specific, cell surface-expressed gene family n=1 Tax=Trypanosoma congolense (strain IL3000) TaxID=1068625 RepID=G0ULT2_TRYCI|nr:hypothetical protein, unlikely [Trypanosoma congolense IL3000]
MLFRLYAFGLFILPLSVGFNAHSRLSSTLDVLLLNAYSSVLRELGFALLFCFPDTQTHRDRRAFFASQLCKSFSDITVVIPIGCTLYSFVTVLITLPLIFFPRFPRFFCLLH